MRDKWIPRAVIKRAAMIPFVGLKNWDTIHT
jgi:hypothetical protein